MAESERRPVEPWFAGKPATVLLFRVNRRPLAQSDLFAEQPESVLDHLAEVLLFGESVITGRRNRREWLLGNRSINERTGQLTGQIGWERTDQRAGDHYNPTSRQWEDVVEDAGVSARAPFLFDASSRILAVLRHSTFSERTIPHVFETLLQRGENARLGRSTEWAVEPILDEGEFREWLETVDSVTKLNMVAKLPNPDALPEFENVWEYMQAKKAKLLRELLEAQDPSVGLSGLNNDQRVNQFVALGTNGFGYVVADGRRDGRDVRYDQRQQSARERTDDLPPNWSDVLGILAQVVRRRERRDRNGDGAP